MTLRSAGLSESAQDYLEAVMLLARVRGMTRVSEIAGHLSVKMPSVVAALKALAQGGLVRYERYGHVALTPAGSRAAAAVYERHVALQRFLTEVLGVPGSRAETEACRLEHALSPGTMRRMLHFLEYARRCRSRGLTCRSAFRHYLTDPVRGRPAGVQSSAHGARSETVPE